MFSHSVHPFLDNTILPYIILKIYSRNLIYSILDPLTLLNLIPNNYNHHHTPTVRHYTYPSNV